MILNLFRPVVLIIGLSLMTGALAAPKRILFVGNSYTHYENMTRTVAAFASTRKIPMETQMATTGGATLEQHWKGAKGEQKLDTLARIESGDFDLIVLQEQSLRPIEAPEKMWRFSENLAEQFREAGLKRFST